MVNAEVAEVCGRAYDRVDFTPGASRRFTEEPHAAVADKDGEVTGNVANVAQLYDPLFPTWALAGFGSHISLEDNPFRFHSVDVLLFYREFKQRLDNFVMRHETPPFLLEPREFVLAHPAPAADLAVS
jgi:hypothetical protein